MFQEVAGRKEGLLSRVFDLVEKGVDEAERLIGDAHSHEAILARSFYSFLRFNDSFEDALIAAVNLSGPSDVQGGLAGALMGSYKGYESIPGKWSERVSSKSRMEALSKSLYKALLKKQAEA